MIFCYQQQTDGQPTTHLHDAILVHRLTTPSDHLASPMPVLPRNGTLPPIGFDRETSDTSANYSDKVRSQYSTFFLRGKLCRDITVPFVSSQNLSSLTLMRVHFHNIIMLGSA